MHYSLTLLGTTCLLILAPSVAAAQAQTHPAGTASASPGVVEASTSVTEAQVRNLWRLGKVWGFLKYHHPAIAAGDVDWDAELIERIPSVMAASDRESGHTAISAWINAVPAPEPSERRAADPSKGALAPDLDWIHDVDLLGEPLSDYLEAVYAGRHQDGDQHYVTRGRGAGNPVFEAEKAYADQDMADERYQLLGLFRFWNIIQWWSPYLDLVEGDWNQVLERFIPRVLACKDRADYGLALVELSALVRDTHTSIWGTYELRPPTGPLTLPVTLSFVEGKAVVWNLWDTAGESQLMRGDALVSIDGRPVSEMIEEIRPYYAASNEPARLRGMARTLGRSSRETATLLVERGSETLELEVGRVEPNGKANSIAQRRDRPGPAFQMLSDEVAYLKLSDAKVSEVERYLELAEGTRGLIVDIRNYPSEFMILYRLAGHLVKESTQFALFTVPDYGNPGANVWRSGSAISPLDPHYPGKIAVLVDESSISRAEFTTMAYQATPNAFVLGSTTAGADGNASHFNLPGGFETIISGIGVHYPDRAPAQRVGVKIDIPCRPTIEGIREGRDELVEEAVRRILED